jgi:hypothetical protein
MLVVGRLLNIKDLEGSGANTLANAMAKEIALEIQFDVLINESSNYGTSITTVNNRMITEAL